MVGWAIVWLRRRLNDAPVEITISLLTPFAAYLPAERLGLSGVLATATAGVFVGWFAPRIMGSDTRLRGRAGWEFLVFVLNGLGYDDHGVTELLDLDPRFGRTPSGPDCHHDVRAPGWPILRTRARIASAFSG